MKILVVVPWDQRHGGVASVVGNLVRYLDRQGHDVVMLHPEDTNRRRRKRTAWGFAGYGLNLRAPVVPGRTLRSVIAFWLFLPYTLMQLSRIIRDHEIQCINVHYPLDSFVALVLCRRLFGVRLVISIHGDDILPEGRRPARHSRALHALLASADLVIAPSRRFLSDALACFPRVRCRAVAIHNGIDPAWWEEVSRAVLLAGDTTRPDSLAEADPRLNPRADPTLGTAASMTVRAGRTAPAPYLLCVAAHYERKGIDVLLRAFRDVREAHPEHRLVLVGDGPRRAELEALAARLGLADAVTFAGDRPPALVRRLVARCTLFVLPTRYESFGVAVVEAMALGRPVVASAVGGIPEIITDGRDGLLVPPDDATALAGAINRCLADPAFAASLGEAAARRARAAFTASRTGERYAAELTRLVGALAPPAAEGHVPTSRSETRQAPARRRRTGVVG